MRKMAGFWKLNNGLLHRLLNTGDCLHRFDGTSVMSVWVRFFVTFIFYIYFFSKYVNYRMEINTSFSWGNLKLKFVTSKLKQWINALDHTQISMCTSLVNTIYTRSQKIIEKIMNTMFIQQPCLYWNKNWTKCSSKTKKFTKIVWFWNRWPFTVDFISMASQKWSLSYYILT